MIVLVVFGFNGSSLELYRVGFPGECELKEKLSRHIVSIMKIVKNIVPFRYAAITLQCFADRDVVQELVLVKVISYFFKFCGRMLRADSNVKY